MYRCLVSAFVVLLVVGCSAKQPEPVKPENVPPPEPTPQELYSSKLKPVIDVLSRPVNAGGALTMAEVTKVTEDLRGARSELAAKDNGRQALSKFQTDIEDLVKKGRNQQCWLAVKGCCMSYSILQPGNDRYAKLELRADLMLKRPVVTVKGFFQVGDGKELYAFLDVKDKETGAVTSHKVREGEEFHSVLQLVRIVGDQQAVEILYIPVGDTWTVKGVSQ